MSTELGRVVGEGQSQRLFVVGDNPITVGGLLVSLLFLIGVWWSFGVAYGTPKKRVREAGIAAARRVAGVVEADRMRSEVWLVGYGDSSMNCEPIVWADRALTTHPARSRADLMWALDDELLGRGIEIPLPQRDLNIRSGTLDVRLANGAALPLSDP